MKRHELNIIDILERVKTLINTPLKWSHEHKPSNGYNIDDAVYSITQCDMKASAIAFFLSETLYYMGLEWWDLYEENSYATVITAINLTIEFRRNGIL